MIESRDKNLSACIKISDQQKRVNDGLAKITTQIDESRAKESNLITQIEKGRDRTSNMMHHINLLINGRYNFEDDETKELNIDDVPEIKERLKVIFYLPK